jgi:hypothetical protein
MTPKELAEILRSSVVDENVAVYRELFENTSIEAASDQYWKNALNLFRTLSASEQEAFFAVVRQVVADTVSNVLGIIDGVSSIDVPDVEFTLLANNSPEPLNGDLQSAFLLAEEQSANSTRR